MFWSCHSVPICILFWGLILQIHHNPSLFHRVLKWIETFLVEGIVWLFLTCCNWRYGVKHFTKSISQLCVGCNWLTGNSSGSSEISLNIKKKMKQGKIIQSFMSCVKTSKNVLPVYFFRKKVLFHVDYETCVMWLRSRMVRSCQFPCDWHKKLRQLPYNQLKNESKNKHRSKIYTFFDSSVTHLILTNIINNLIDFALIKWQNQFKKE